MAEPQSIDRHYGLDWLRIAAFGLLILYHIGMYFGPIDWVVNAHAAWYWLAYPLALVSPWRLELLFAISGYASAAMLARSPGVRAFFRERSKRLLIPLACGMVVIVPPQEWVRTQIGGGYAHDMAYFWTHEAFSFTWLAGQLLPNWEHLWFLGYLWGYTALLVAALALVPHIRKNAARFADWLGEGHRLLLLPIFVIVLSRLGLMYLHMDDAQRYSDLVGDVHYIPAFGFGVVLAWDKGVWVPVRRIWPMALVICTICAATIVSMIAIYGANADLPFAASLLQTAADSALAWAMIPVLLMLADRFLNRDHRWRTGLAQAVFPAYIVHQTVIVVAGFYLRDMAWPPVLAFIWMLALVAAVCIITYMLARRFRLAGTMFGLPHKAPAKGQLSRVS